MVACGAAARLQMHDVGRCDPAALARPPGIDRQCSGGSRGAVGALQGRLWCGSDDDGTPAWSWPHTMGGRLAGAEGDGGRL